MPVSVITARDPFHGRKPPDTTKPAPDTGLALRTPQARVLAALMPYSPDDHPSEWPLLTRAALGVRAGYTAISGTVTRALNGIRSYGTRTSGDPHPGLLERGMVETVSVDVDGKAETNHRITPLGIQAYQAYAAVYGSVPTNRDAASCTNHRYKKEQS